MEDGLFSADGWRGETGRQRDRDIDRDRQRDRETERQK